jgi:hypothetical protein
MRKITNCIAVAAIAFTAVLAGGCAQEVSHTEKDSPNWTDNGHTKTESTTYQNPDGSTYTQSSKTRTSN